METITVAEKGVNMQVIRKKLSELHKTDRNIRRHSEKQIREYVRSLEMFGQTRPFVVTEDGEILVGNGMYDAMLSMGAEEGEVYVVEGLTEIQKKKLMLADNKVFELGFTDIGVLDDILPLLDGDFDVPGYDADLLETISASLSEADDLVLGYGTDSVPLAGEREDTRVTRAQDDSPQYAPPVKTNDGEIVAPDYEDEGSGRYIICPRCGEKIWL